MRKKTISRYLAGCILLLVCLLASIDAYVSTAVRAEPAPSPATVTAEPSPQKFYVQGKAISFRAYLIGGNNYIQLRDIARAVDFGVDYDARSKTVRIDPDGSYNADGGASSALASSPASAEKSGQTFLVGEEKVSFRAYLIAGNNYIQLRDVARAVDFGVSYDANTKTVGLDPSTGYVEEGAKPEKQDEKPEDTKPVKTPVKARKVAENTLEATVDGKSVTFYLDEAKLYQATTSSKPTRDSVTYNAYDEEGYLLYSLDLRIPFSDTDTEFTAAKQPRAAVYFTFYSTSERDFGFYSSAKDGASCTVTVDEPVSASTRAQRGTVSGKLVNDDDNSTVRITDGAFHYTLGEQHPIAANPGGSGKPSNTEKEEPEKPSKTEKEEPEAPAGTEEPEKTTDTAKSGENILQAKINGEPKTFYLAATEKKKKLPSNSGNYCSYAAYVALDGDGDVEYELDLYFPLKKEAGSYSKAAEFGAFRIRLGKDGYNFDADYYTDYSGNFHKQGSFSITLNEDCGGKEQSGTFSAHLTSVSGKKSPYDIKDATFHYRMGDVHPKAAGVENGGGNQGGGTGLEEILCPDCGGGRKTTCTHCDGVGYTYTYKYTIGGMKKVKTTCAFCTGTGRMTCRTCGGTGKIVV